MTVAKRKSLGRTFTIGTPGPMTTPSDIGMGQRRCSDGKMREWHQGWTVIKVPGQVARAFRNYEGGGANPSVAVRYPARPVMQPALEKSTEKLTEFWKDTI